MKKSLLLFASGMLVVSAYAQTPIKENVPFVGKITANWCPPCGGWGFKLYDDILVQHGDHATGLSMYSSTRTDNNNQKFQNQAAYDLAAQITLTGYPSFSVNLVDLSAQNQVGSGIDTHGIHVDVDSFYAAFMAQPVAASVGMTYRINGNTVEVKTKTKFWEAANGTYKVAVYLVEDGATAGQVTPSGTVTK
ncbi:MAG TPA: hypothetical protein VEB40_14800, partial [Flavipsychrobacter sp.]|nr:hypothetical protein [Flavipsychrobacter sp.]